MGIDDKRKSSGSIVFEKDNHYWKNTDTIPLLIKEYQKKKLAEYSMCKNLLEEF